jgi:hypothetical protein
VPASLPSHGSSLSNAPHGGTRCDEETPSPLHGTRLQPTHRLTSAGSSTSQFVLGRHLLSFLSGFSKLSRDERPDGSLPAFAWGDVAPHGAQPLSAPLQGGLRFFRPPLPAVPSPSLAVRIPREVGLNGLTQLTTAELRASPVGARLPVGQRMSLPAGISGSPPHVPFGHGHQPLGPFLTHERGSPFACAQPSGASLGRFCFEAGRLRPLSPELSHLPVTRDARLGRDTWTSQGLHRISVGHTLMRAALHQ